VGEKKLREPHTLIKSRGDNETWQSIVIAVRRREAIQLQKEKKGKSYRFSEMGKGGNGDLKAKGSGGQAKITSWIFRTRTNQGGGSSRRWCRGDRKVTFINQTKT